jgi:mannose-6-phosphate isomerase-like protein (cupin superfamily)
MERIGAAQVTPGLRRKSGTFSESKHNFCTRRAASGGFKVRRTPLMLFGVAALCIFAAGALTANAQGSGSGSGGGREPAQAPSTPGQEYLVLSGPSVDQTIKELAGDNKIKNLVSGAGVGCRVFIQHEKNVLTSQAEVHDGADDVFVILEGSATLILGGRLDSPNQSQPGEWRAAAITGGTEFKLAKGDVVVVPRGTPHRRITPGQDVTLMVIKSTTPAAKP